MRLFFKIIKEIDSRLSKVIRCVVEACLMFLYLYFSFSMGLNGVAPVELWPLNLGIWVASYIIFGLHSDRLRYANLRSYFGFLLHLLIFVSANIGFLITLSIEKYYEILIVLSFIYLNSSIIIRIFARELVRSISRVDREKVIVFGKDELIVDFVNALTFGKKYKPVAIIAEFGSYSRKIAGIPIIEKKDLQDFALSNDCTLVVIPKASDADTVSQETLRFFDSIGLSVSYAPSVDRGFEYEVQLKAVNPAEVLGRGIVTDYEQRIQDYVHSATILVTGAAGSIGSEICRQLLRYKPEKLIALDHSEFALYNLEQELTANIDLLANCDVQFVLGSVVDHTFLETIFINNQIDCVYHAAAYKHVPLFEENILSGVKNNVFGTETLANLAESYKVGRFILVSTDKAVRPTNVMGASKRLSELICQTRMTESTKYSMVRFGNVLGSSGSVIPKFKKQILSGGPLTVTHADITRYFMSIPEAAHLVMSAGAMGKGGEVFVLDMGDPVKILDLAKSMIRQHGLQPVLMEEDIERKKRSNEIIIDFTGLRPGEKLFEELLVTGTAEASENPKIFRCYDETIEHAVLKNALQKLKNALIDNDGDTVISLLKSLPLGYKTCPETNEKQSADVRIEATCKKQLEEPAKGGDYLRNSETKTIGEPITIVQKIVSHRLFLKLLHTWFWLSRGLTVGVRVAIFSDANEVLLVRHTYIPGWYLPGGGVDRGETILQAAKREVFEETGLSGLDFDPEMHFFQHSDVSNADHIVFLKAKSSEDIGQYRSAEIAEVRFFKIDQLPNGLDKGSKQRILELQFQRKRDGVPEYWS